MSVPKTGSRVNNCQGALPYSACAFFRTNLLLCHYWIITAAKTKGWNWKTWRSVEVVQGHNESQQDKQRTDDRHTQDETVMLETQHRRRNGKERTNFNSLRLQFSGVRRWHYLPNARTCERRRRRARQKRIRIITVQPWVLVRDSDLYWPGLGKTTHRNCMSKFVSVKKLKCIMGILWLISWSNPLQCNECSPEYFKLNT